jgi:dihydroorotase
MTIHIPHAKIVYPSHPLNGQNKHVWLHEGKLYFNNEGLPEAQQLQEGLCVSPGWVDMQARVYEPGHEIQETIATLAQAARHGGFTSVAVLPNSNPVVDGREGVHYLKQMGLKYGLNILPIGAVTQQTKGEKMAEMLDMDYAGAAAFSDGKPVSNPDIVLKTLQYLQHVDGLLIQRAEEPMLAAFGQMNEGMASLMLGLEGLPELAEEVMVSRDIQLLQYTGGKIHFSLISSPGSLKHIAEAKAKGLDVTCSMAAHQLCFTDHDLMGFETNFKVSPPFRSQATNAELKKALLEGLIDVVVSDHNPMIIDQKNCEFDVADFGVSSLETAFHSLLQTLGPNQENKLVELLALNPARLLKLELPQFENGQPIDVTVFTTEGHTVISRDYFLSKGFNSPFIGKTLPGKVIGTLSQGVWVQHADSIPSMS